MSYIAIYKIIDKNIFLVYKKKVLKIYDIDNIDKEYTYIFELVSPENKIVINYDKTHLYHIGTRNNITGQEIDTDIGIEKPKEYSLTTFDECLKAVEELNKDKTEHEGFVVVDKDYNRIKIKTPEYVALHHLSNNNEIITSKDKVIALLKSDDLNEKELLKQYPEYEKVFNFYKLEMERVNIELYNYIKEIKALEIAFKGDRKQIANTIKDTKYSWFGFKCLGNDKTVQELLSECSDKQYLSLINDYKE